MEGLISAAEMEAIREVPLAGMATPCSILSLEPVPVADGDDRNEWVETASTVCWIWEPLGYPRGGEVGGVQGIAHEFRAYLPIDTDLEVGDRLGVDGEIYNVVNTNAGDTYRPMLRAALRKVE